MSILYSISEKVKRNFLFFYLYHFYQFLFRHFLLLNHVVQVSKYVLFYIIERMEVKSMSINQRVKEIRQTLNLSQAKFAKELSISNGYIAGIELEHNNVNERLVKLICFTFHVDENWLKTGEGDMFSKQSSQLSELASTAFVELKPLYQEYILKQIDLLLEIQNKENNQ